jgi:hypothetical protein
MSNDITALQTTGAAPSVGPWTLEQIRDAAEGAGVVHQALTDLPSIDGDIAAAAQVARDVLSAIVTDAEEAAGRTPHGFDRRWLAPINGALADRGAAAQVDDLDDDLWDRYLGPLLDALEERPGTPGGSVDPVADARRSMLNVSTGHITEAEMNDLQRMGRGYRPDEPLWVIGDRHGCFIQVHDELEDAAAALPNRPDYTALLRLLRLCKERDIHWLRLDADGDHIDGLPVFDWPTR